MVRVGATLAILAALAVMFVAWRPSTPEVLVQVACAFAVEVDGVLHCDDEAPRDLTALCGPGAAAGALTHGDAVSRAQLCAVEAPRPGVAGWGRMRGEDLAALDVPVDVNRAALEELESLPGIGPALAQRIVDGRPYASVEALLSVRGIGPVRLSAVRARVRVDAAEDVH